jgi:hypothetical protein
MKQRNPEEDSSQKCIPSKKTEFEIVRRSIIAYPSHIIVNPSHRYGPMPTHAMHSSQPYKTTKNPKTLIAKSKMRWEEDCLAVVAVVLPAIIRIQYPVVVGGVSQCRSICSSASFHSYAKQSASSCASCASGIRPPHISGLAASLVAYAWIIEL